MKRQIIDKVFSEYENKIHAHSFMYDIKFKRKNTNWDWEYYIHQQIDTYMDNFLINECTDISKYEKIGERYFIVFEQTTENNSNGGNQPPREIFIGEFIKDEINWVFKVRGKKLSFNGYCNEIHEFIIMMNKLKELDEYKSVFLNKMKDFI
jgi:hypothetical protein